ncbi:hypothetical protein BCR43DRAFT_504141 [Syncephalastrum racemosum]|uniref:Uncharacterized protein n=1 Tax=Syncephalastrum racemosum TaxID=13706 RepID=A0A1X2HDY2_SYNRA|nr:hypothetical protein BCR43DRAFT_504141 [Syncephalastrum racemosum]
MDTNNSNNSYDEIIPDLHYVTETGVIFPSTKKTLTANTNMYEVLLFTANEFPTITILHIRHSLMDTHRLLTKRGRTAVQVSVSGVGQHMVYARSKTINMAPKVIAVTHLSILKNTLPASIRTVIEKNAEKTFNWTTKVSKVLSIHQPKAKRSQPVISKNPTKQRIRLRKLTPVIQTPDAPDRSQTSSPASPPASPPHSPPPAPPRQLHHQQDTSSQRHQHTPRYTRHKTKHHRADYLSDNQLSQGQVDPHFDQYIQQQLPPQRRRQRSPSPDPLDDLSSFQNLSIVSDCVSCQERVASRKKIRTKSPSPVPQTAPEHYHPSNIIWD